MDIIVLSNGKKVGNFSSPHPFTFDDGNILPAINDEDSLHLKIDVQETITDDIKGDMRLAFSLSPQVKEHMDAWMSLYSEGEVDVVYCPLMMLQAIVEELGKDYLYLSPFRAVRMKDRIKKLVSIDHQTVI